MKTIFLILLVLNISACTSRSEKYTEMRELMTTAVEVTVCADRQNQKHIAPAYAQMWQRLEEIAWRMNVYDDQSDVAKINGAGGQIIEIPPDTYRVIEQAVVFSEMTGGAFDITVWPLMKLWKQLKVEKRLPTEEELNLMRTIVGYRHIELLGDHRVRLLESRTALDLGGIAAGYAVDEAAGILRQHGFRNFFIDLGGDMYVEGGTCAGGPWKLGIRDPKQKDQMMDVVFLSNAGITTSGHYEKFFEIDGKKYSHIMDPRSAMPQEGTISATVIAPTTIAADALATAMCVMKPEEAVALIDSLGEGYAVILMTQDAGGGTEVLTGRRFGSYRVAE